MTYFEICERLRAAGIESADYEAARLLEHFCSVGREKLPFCREMNFDSEELSLAIARREKREPLQYIIGEWNFCSENYFLNEHCLIPRPDTELLVEQGVKKLPEGGSFADLGCGSGCVSVSLLAARDDARGLAFDISEGAVQMTGKNAEANGVGDRLCAAVGDIFGDKLWERIKEFAPDMIISNPPYIPTAEVDRLSPELFFEPRRALDGGEDGLDFYRRIIEGGGKVLREGGILLFETGAGQTADVSRIARESGFDCEIYYDIEGRDRVVSAKKQGKEAL